MRNISASDFSKLLLRAANTVEANTEILSQIDSRFGDGDHGLTMGKIAKQIRTSVELWEDNREDTWKQSHSSLKSLLEALGTAIMALSGGSAGPLWGTLVGGLALPLAPTQSTLTAAEIKAMLVSCLEEMQGITTAKVGDKTMMDALIPAVEAATQAEDDVQKVLQAAATAAAQGAKDSEAFISKFGRAKSYKEQTIGTPDAGAVSMSLFFRGLAEEA